MTILSRFHFCASVPCLFGVPLFTILTVLLQVVILKFCFVNSVRASIVSWQPYAHSVATIVPSGNELYFKQLFSDYGMFGAFVPLTVE